MISTKAIEIRELNKIKAIRKNAMKSAKKVADFLKERYEVKRVVLFGSLPSKPYLHERTDIDLLVEGLDRAELLRAGFDAEELAVPFEVDIIPMEIAAKKLIEIALEEGIEL